MVNVLISLRLWAKWWAHSTVVVHCDNLAVVQLVNFGSFLSTCIRNLWLITATYDIQLTPTHVQGKKNFWRIHFPGFTHLKAYPKLFLITSQKTVTGKKIPNNTLTLTFGSNFRWQPSFPAPPHLTMAESPDSSQTCHQQSTEYPLQNFPGIFAIL